MRNTFVSLALAAHVLATPMPQAVTSAVAPEAPVPSGCETSHEGTFQITVVNVSSSSKRDVERRQLSGILTLTLSDEDLKDQAGRTGYIASNYQFQFDSPPQAGAIYTSGFSLCSNNSLALGGSSIFYQCWSGGFFNLYDRDWAEHCVPIYLIAQSFSGGGQVTQISDGQPGASSAVPITQISDGQPQQPTNAPVSQISDGQPQVPTGGAPVSQISDGQPQVPTGAPVSQISDGQPQVPTGAPVSQISDGQPQVPTGAPVSQISDGQPQVPTGAPVSQISDGQPQVPTVGPPVTQISDGQPQAPTGAPVSQISDGQPQAPVASPTGNVTGNATVTAAPSQFTGAAASPAYGMGALAAGILGAVVLL